MKKVFLIFSMAGCLSLINGINNANAVQSETTVVTFTCPAGCELLFTNYSDAAGMTIAHCVGPNGDSCGDPTVSVEVLNPDNAISPVTPVVKPTDLKPSKKDKVNLKKSNNVSARAGKLKTRDTNNISAKPQKIDMASDEPVVVINCPSACPNADCWSLGNVIMCQCKDASGKVCTPDDVITTSDSASSVK